MAQFDVHRLSSGALVLDCQAEGLSHFGTRVVAPLLPKPKVPPPTARLHPIFRREGVDLVLATQLLATLPRRELGRPIASLAHERYTIVAALDMLIAGV